jgi:hypothetical protein
MGENGYFCPSEVNAMLTEYGITDFELRRDIRELLLQMGDGWNADREAAEIERKAQQPKT